MTIYFFLITFLLQINAAPQAGQSLITAPSQEGHAAGPAVAAPFKLLHPLCGADFATITQRIDTRDRFGIIVKRQWVMTGCAKGKIIYGGRI